MVRCKQCIILSRLVEDKKNGPLNQRPVLASGVAYKPRDDVLFFTYCPRLRRALAAMRMRSAFSLMKPPASAWL